MKMLEAGGVPILADNLRQADIDNPNGYYEVERVKALSTGDVAWLNAAQGKAIKVISALLVHLPAEHTYRVIFMQRNMQEIIESQRRMLIHRNKPHNADEDSRLADLYTKHLDKMKQWVSEQPNFASLVVDYGKLVNDDPHAAIQRIVDFLQKPLDVERMQESINPALYRNRA